MILTLLGQASRKPLAGNRALSLLEEDSGLHAADLFLVDSIHISKNGVLPGGLSWSVASFRAWSKIHTTALGIWTSCLMVKGPFFNGHDMSICTA